MSDSETILQALKQAESRIRINRFLGRAGASLSIWVGIAVVMKAWDLVSPFSGSTLQIFWFGWALGLIINLWFCRLGRQRLGRTAAEVDQKAGLEDELLSAYWFLSQKINSPWVDLQIRRASGKISQIDVAELYPRVLPRSSYLVPIGLVLLAALSLSPLPFAPTTGFSEPTGAPSAVQALMQEIEDLLMAADRVQPDDTLAEFQALMESIEDLTLSPTEADQQLGNIQDSVAEGNLDVSNLIEGLQEVGADLMQSEDSALAGEALANSDLSAAAAALEELGAELGAGRPPAEDLQSALDEAGESSYSGLEQLTGDLGAAADALESGTAESGAAVEDALRGAAESLAELASVVEGQQLRNEAAGRMESLQELLEQQMAQAAAENAATGEQSAGQSEGQGEPGSEGTPSESGAQPGTGEGETSPLEGQPSEAESALADMMAASAGEVGDFAAGGGGETPVGLGFSPGQVEGPPTSLEVQLQEELVQLPVTDTEEGTESEEEASRRETSILDYRNLPSELTRAQQDLLHQDRIPREYRNLIRDYFERIRGDQ